MKTQKKPMIKSRTLFRFRQQGGVGMYTDPTTITIVTNTTRTVRTAARPANEN